jgi:hypothetical protein
MISDTSAAKDGAPALELSVLWKIVSVSQVTGAHVAAQTTSRIFADMTERYEASMLALNSMELDTKQVLSASGIDTMYIVFYLDFARQLFHLSHGRSISGPTLAREAQVLLEKWQNRGLDPAVLAAIRFEVFSVPVPAP